MTQQISCLPTVVCQRTIPPPATVAADFVGVDESSTHRWLCKGQGKHPLLPATEWICSTLASSCGLPVPPIAAVEIQAQPGVSYFGSQWQGGALEFLQVMGKISNPDIFVKTHAVDLFVHNTDRHTGNYLYLNLYGDIVARVIDFSHAWMVEGWPLPNLPMAVCNTTLELPKLLAQNSSPYQRPDDVLDKISILPDDWMYQTLGSMPKDWLSDSHRAALDQWWRSASRTDRIDKVKLSLP